MQSPAAIIPLDHAEIKSRASMSNQDCRHLGFIHPNPDLEACYPRLCDLKDCRPDAKSITNTDFGICQTSTVRFSPN